ncbi:methyltransferase domain-containing protein [Pseudonocardia acaciae]|uniref:methyltransferase domain-containing protein n=1 Tax=Pseudonocardia acaciae TaxID=551276 RepID=UPI000562BE14|nr:methyltransferase domain-containing protein [Pseudonocardia acaciae]
MLVTSRSAAEYRAMFDLTATDLAAGSVLDCCAGGSSFAAETGARVVAVDPAYAIGRRALAETVLSGLRDGDRIIDRNRERFEWGWYGTPERRAAARVDAAHRFLADLGERPGRYLAGALPHLPLADASFELVLCSHMLFTWANQLDADWHRAALAELVRVSRREVRVFPLVVQGTGEPVGFLDELRTGLAASGHRTEVRDVPYRFQRGAHAMLVVRTGRR